MDTRIDTFTRTFFWAGYVVFLSASIPHIAAYFRHFDPATSNRWEDAAYWVIATAIAIVIDVSDVLVSIAVMRAQSTGARGKDVFGFWCFIVFIMILSWFVNWQYNVVFGTHEFGKVDNYRFIIPFISFSVGQINPVIGSAFQVLLLVYTSMAHKFAQKPREKPLEELQKEAQDAQQRAGYLATIDATKQAQKARSRDNILGDLKGWKDGVIGALGKDPKDLTFIDSSEASHEALNGGARDTNVVGRFDGDFDDEESMFNGNENHNINASEMVVVDDDFDEEVPSKTIDNNGASERNTGKLSVTVKEAALMLVLSESRVRELRKAGKLRSPGRNKKLILMSSVKALLEDRQKVRGNGVHEVRQEHQQSADNFDKLSATLTAMESDPDITDEELAEILGLSRVHSARSWRLKAEEILTTPQR